MAYRCKNCGYYFKSTDSDLCPECFTVRDDKDYEAFGNDDMTARSTDVRSEHDAADPSYTENTGTNASYTNTAPPNYGNFNAPPFNPYMSNPSYVVVQKKGHPVRNFIIGALVGVILFCAGCVIYATIADDDDDTSSNDYMIEVEPTRSVLDDISDIYIKDEGVVEHDTKKDSIIIQVESSDKITEYGLKYHKFSLYDNETHEKIDDLRIDKIFFDCYDENGERVVDGYITNANVIPDHDEIAEYKLSIYYATDDDPNGLILFRFYKSQFNDTFNSTSESSTEASE